MLQMIFAAAALAIYWNSAGIARNPTSDFTGADLITVCSRADSESAGFCDGYVQAVVDGLAKPWSEVCTPEGASRTDIMNTVIKHLTMNHTSQSLNAASGVYDALVTAYPCRD